MARPSNPNAITLTQLTLTIPEVKLAWTYDLPSEVDRWHIGFVAPAGDFETWGIFTRDTLMVSSGSYLISVPSPKATSWYVGALNAAGETSQFRRAFFDGDVHGTWILPSRDGKLANGSSIPEDLRIGFLGGITRSRELEAILHPAPYREARILDVGKLHTWAGEIDGALAERKVGAEVVPISEFEARLVKVIATQQRYRVAVVTHDHLFPNIGFVTGLAATDDPDLAGTSQPTSLGFVAL